ncbi:ABC transporter permease [Roseibium sediminicola]|uniref:ABC transporter permease n=1 Tax=Roseibium sediminicola TaxID=2933272 RepID=A0ABT0H204_9HYPH|nr:ABC transporter permease [Roseibium sp. CAU 1639]MCK7615723.1 ABC transporter permease [Roseibium sp. CAU 1639]
MTILTRDTGIRIRTGRSVDPAIIGPSVVLLTMLATYAALSPHFLTFSNFSNVLVQAAPLVILATGQTFVVLIGGLDLSQGSIVSLVSVVTAAVMMNHGIEVAILAGLGSGTCVGVLNGFLVGRLGLQPFIVTLGMLYMVAGVALVLSEGSAIFGLPQPDVETFFWFGGGKIGFLPVPLIIAVLVVLGARHVLGSRVLGRHTYAVGSNASVAALSGVDVRRTRMWVFLISALLASLAGFLLSGRVISGQPLLGAGDLLLQSIGAVIIGGTSIFGGRGGVLRTVLGVLVIAFMVNGLNLLAISTFTQQVIIGAIIVFSAWLNTLGKTRA